MANSADRKQLVLWSSKTHRGECTDCDATPPVKCRSTSPVLKSTCLVSFTATLVLILFDTPILNKPPTADGSPAIIKLKSWVRKCKTHDVFFFGGGSFDKQTADGESQQSRGKQKELRRVQLNGNRLYRALVSRTEPCVMIMNDILLENTEQTQTQPTTFNTYT